MGGLPTLSTPLSKLSTSVLAMHNRPECYGLGLNKMLCKHPDGDTEKYNKLWIKPFPMQWI